MRGFIPFRFAGEPGSLFRLRPIYLQLRCTMVASRAPELWGTLGVFLVLAWIFTALRVYVRAWVSRSWGADDFLLLAALV